MKKKIAILGSTGSIGKSLIDIIKKDKKNFEIVLLTANKNYKELFKQSKLLKVKNLIMTDYRGYKILRTKNKKIKIYNNYSNLNKILKKKNRLYNVLDNRFRWFRTYIKNYSNDQNYCNSK